MGKNIFFISDGSVTTSSTVHRCLLISKELEKKGYSCEIFTRNNFHKIPNIINQIKNWTTIKNKNPDILIIHRTSNLIDYLMLKKLPKSCKVIFDFDDAVFHIRIPGRLISYSHTSKIIKKADAVTAGSHYLFNYAKKYNNNTFLVPTSVNTDLFKKINEKKPSEKIIIGWLGNGNKYQLKYLKILKTPLRMLSEHHNIKFRIVSALSPEVRQEFKNEPYEVDFGLDEWVSIEKIPKIISDFDIGVMPLSDDSFSKGKCSMKALEYMGMGIPVVVSSVGENYYVIKNGYNGFLASNYDEWYKSLEKLISNQNYRQKIGNNGYNTIKEKYSIDSIVKTFIDIFERLK